MLKYGLSLGHSRFLLHRLLFDPMLILYLPMMFLLLVIVVVSSERTLERVARENHLPRSSPGLTLRKIIQDIIAQTRVLVATIKPTSLRMYSRYRNSVNTVKITETMKAIVFRLSPILTAKLRSLTVKNHINWIKRATVTIKERINSVFLTIILKIKTGVHSSMKVKGTALVFLPTFIKEKFGEDQFKEWLESLPSESKKIYGKQILASQWYSLDDAFTVPLKSICERFYNGDPKASWELGRYSADYGLKGVYKLLVRLGSPEALAKRAGSVIEKYYNPSKIDCVEAVKHHSILRVTKFPDWNRHIEYRIGGYMERGIEISGGKDPKVKIPSSMTKGHPYTEYEISWS